jgi:hypothetical protein
MKPTVYLETSIVSYLAAQPSRDLITAARQQVKRLRPICVGTRDQ